MSKLGPPPSASRFAAWAQMIRIVFSGKTTPWCSCSSSTIRAVNGVTGATRMISPTAAAARSGSRAEQLPLLGMGGEQPQRVGELRLGRVDPADEHVEDQVSQLGVVEAIVAVAGGDQGREQVLARRRRACARRGRRGRRRAPRRRARPRRGARRASARRTGAGSSATRRRAARRPRSARRRRWRSSSPGRAGSARRPRRTRRRRRRRRTARRGSRASAGRQRSAARGVNAGLTRLRRRRWSSPSRWRMLRATSSPSAPSFISNSSASALPGKVVCFERRKCSPRLAVEDHVAELRAHDPALGGELGHPRVERRAAQARVELVELRQVQLGQGRGAHRLLSCPSRRPRGWRSERRGVLVARLIDPKPLEQRLVDGPDRLGAGRERADVAGTDLDLAAVPGDRRPAFDDDEGLLGLDVGEGAGGAAPDPGLGPVGPGR